MLRMSARDLVCGDAAQRQFGCESIISLRLCNVPFMLAQKSQQSAAATHTHPSSTSLLARYWVMELVRYAESISVREIVSARRYAIPVAWLIIRAATLGCAPLDSAAYSDFVTACAVGSPKRSNSVESGLPVVMLLPISASSTFAGALCTRLSTIWIDRRMVSGWSAVRISACPSSAPASAA